MPCLRPRITPTSNQIKTATSNQLNGSEWIISGDGACIYLAAIIASEVPMKRGKSPCLAPICLVGGFLFDIMDSYLLFCNKPSFNETRPPFGDLVVSLCLLVFHSSCRPIKTRSSGARSRRFTKLAPAGALSPRDKSLPGDHPSLARQGRPRKAHQRHLRSEQPQLSSVFDAGTVYRTFRAD